MVETLSKHVILISIVFCSLCSAPSLFAQNTQVKLPVEAPPKYTWTLDDVKKIAFEHNPDLKSARANYDAAKMGVGVAVSGYLPHVDIYAKYDQTTLPEPSAGATAQLGLSLPYKMVTASLNQTIFDFGKTLSQISQSRSTSNASEQQAVAVHNAVELAVQKAFYDVQSTAQLVDVAMKGLARFQETLRRTTVLVHTGSKPKFDLTQANVEAAKAKLALINAQNTYEFARIALLDLIGMTERATFKLVDQGTPAEFAGVASERLKLERLVTTALNERPEMKRQQYSLEAARFALSGEIRNYLPSVSLHAWGGKLLPDYPPEIANPWGIAVVGTWHVFQGLETTFRVGQASANVDGEEALVEKDRLSITSDVTRGYDNLNRSENNLQVAVEALDASMENFNLAQKRYDANVATILELLVAEDSLLGSEATAVTARFDHEIALATLRNAVNAPLKDELNR